MDVVSQIRKYNAGREPERLALKYKKMFGDAFSFLRGSCHLFHDRLPTDGVFASAPAAWACGDLHLENFGSYKADNRGVQFDINDFDEAALAPASWDLARLLTSLRVGAAGLGIDAAESAALCGALLDGYVAALAAGKAGWIDRDAADGQVRLLLDALRNRKRADYIGKRTDSVDGHLRLRADASSDKARPATNTQRATVAAFMEQFAASQPDPAFFKLLDVARRVAGTGSLGIERYVLLVRGKGGGAEGAYLLDFKHARPSSLLPHLTLAQPAWESEAHRIVALQRRMQAASMAFLQPVQFGDQPFVLRALQPSEDRVTLDRRAQSKADLRKTIVTLGRLLAWAQLRSSGRQGSATADALIDWAQPGHWQPEMLAASERLAAQVRDDSATFDAAYRDGAFA